MAIFLISGFYLTINNNVFEFDYSNFSNIMSPGITVKTSGKKQFRNSLIVRESRVKFDLRDFRFLDIFRSSFFKLETKGEAIKHYDLLIKPQETLPAKRKTKLTDKVKSQDGKNLSI